MEGKEICKGSERIIVALTKSAFFVVIHTISYVRIGALLRISVICNLIYDRASQPATTTTYEIFTCGRSTNIVQLALGTAYYISIRSPVPCDAVLVGTDRQ